jgi:hypothetical protein
MPPRFIAVVAIGLCLPVHARAADDPQTLEALAKYQPHVDRGLVWLAKQQFRDGHWEAQGGRYSVAMTALAGMALLAEGSTPHQGRFAKEIDNAVEYLISRSQKNGLLVDSNELRGQQSYMHGHGFATMFLAQVYGEENDERLRNELQRVLTRAVEFIGKAQTKAGGFGYVSAADRPDFDEGSVTITQVQALRAARDAGIPVPKEIIDKAHAYLKRCTQVTRGDNDPLKREAGVTYSLRNASVRAPLTAAGIACLFNAGEYQAELAIQWLNYCQRFIPIDKTGRDGFGHWEYAHYYYSQVLYSLGEDRHAKLRPDLAELEKNTGKPHLLKWSRYRATIHDYICSRQQEDGSWPHASFGPVYTTSMYLTILQLDRAMLPIYQR